MRTFKSSKRILAIVLTLMMVFSMIPSLTPSVYAAGTKQDFPLYSATGQLVADANAKYITTFVQDPETKLITATVAIQNNTTGSGARNMVVNGAGLEISFSDKVAPYAYDPTNLSDPHPYDASRLYIGANSENVNTFRKYCYTPISTFNTIGSAAISNNANKKMIGAKISAGSDEGTITIAPGTTTVLIQFFFMPMNGSDTLNFDMFNYQWETAGLNKVSTWMGNGTRLVVSNERFPSAGYQYVHSPNTFKIHMKHAAPTGLSANPDNQVREIIGYDDSTMEWATDEAGPYTAGTPVISDDAQSVYVRVKGDDNYSGSDAEYGDYKKYLASDAVEVIFSDAFFSVDAHVEKISKNTTAVDGKNHVGDTLQYTITASNDGDSRSVWTDVMVTDKLPEGVTFVSGTVKIDNVTAADHYDSATRTLSVPLGDIAGGAKKEITFNVTIDENAQGKTIINSASVSGKDGEGGEDIDKETEESGGGKDVEGKSPAPIINPITEGDRVITGTGVAGAEIAVTLPDGGGTVTATVGSDSKWTVDIPAGVDLVKGKEVTAIQTEGGKDPSDTAKEIVGGRPSVGGEGNIGLEKSSENSSRGDGTTHVGDTLVYTVKASNQGPEKSLWADAVMTDVLPEGITLEANSVKIDGVTASYTYDDTTRLLTVALGDIVSGVTKTVVFSATVNEKAYGETILNHVKVSGKDDGNGGGDLEKEVDENGGGKEVTGKTATPVIDPITEGDRVITGTGVAGAEVVVTLPNSAGTVTTTVGSDNKWTVDVPAGVDLKKNEEVSAVQRESNKEDSDAVTVTVGGRPSVGGEGNIGLEKSSENVTRQDGTTHVGDTLAYTVKASNQGPEKSLWADAVMTDILPEGITFEENSVKIDGVTASYTYDDTTRLLTVALGDIVSGVTKTVVFSATVNEKAYGETILNHVKVSGKDDGNGGGDLEKEVDENGGGKEVTGKTATPVIDPITEGDRVITGIGVAGAEVVVTLPNSAGTVTTTVGSDNKWTVDVPAGVDLKKDEDVSAVQKESDKEDSDTVTVTVGGRPSVGGEGNIDLEKTSKNTSREDGTTHVGDTLEYTVIASNQGPEKSLWADAVMTDVLPEGITLEANSVKIDGVTASYTYDDTTRLLTVALGDIVSGVTKTVVFNATVNEKAYGETILNHVKVSGKDDGNGGGDLEKEVDENGGGKEVTGKTATPVIDPITEGDRVITGTGEVGAEIVVTLPNGAGTITTTVGSDNKWTVDVPAGVDLKKDDEVSAVQKESGKEDSDTATVTVGGRPSVGGEGNIDLEKSSENSSRQDGTTHVGDTLVYTVKASNEGPEKSLWADAVMTDVLPEGITLEANSVKIDGVTASYTYDDTTRLLTVALGDIVSGVTKTVEFKATVNEKAYGETILNHVKVSGKDEGNGGGDLEKEVDENGGGKEVTGKTATPVIDPITEGDRVITGTGVAGAEVVVTLPNSAGTITATVGSDNKWTVDVPAGVDLKKNEEVSAVQKESNKEDSDEVTATVGGRPSVGGEGNIGLEKSSENTTRQDGTTHVGDTLEYTVIASNQGPEKSLWADAVMTDVLPEGITLEANSVKIDGVTASYTYDDMTRLLTVALGDLVSGASKTIVFSSTVNETAYGQTILNRVKVSGKDEGNGGGDLEKEVEENGGGKDVIGKTDAPFIDEINEGDRVVTGTGIAGATVKVTIQDRPGTIDVTVDGSGIWKVTIPATINLVEGNEVKAVQTEGSLDPSDTTVEIVQAKKTVVPFMEKTSENKSSTDGKTHVGDRIEYTITVRNDGSLKSLWKDVKITDEIPAFVTIDTNSVRLDGAVPTYNFYNPDNRTLYVNAGDFAGGVEKILTFSVTIDKDAYGQDIVNSASVVGKNNGNEDIGTETTEDGGQKVMDKSKEPTVNDVTRGDEKITGEGEPGAEIEVTFPDGSKETTTVDPNGEWSVDVPDDIELGNGDEIDVIQTEDGKEPSDKVTVIVGDKDYRAVTGFVYPMISDDLGLGDEFLRKHDIVVELRATFQTPAAAGLSTTAEYAGSDQGKFTLENVPFGEYVLYIKRPGYLTRCMNVIISADSPDLIELTPPGSENVFNLWWGDVDDNFIIDNLDIMAILESMSLYINALSPDYNPAHDLNGDGLIDNEDIMMVIENLDKTILQYPGAENIDPWS